MTNPQQAQGAADEQEEVQLTELRPVEQSRIKETANGRDGTNDTDGLRALRSFASGHVDLGEFGSDFRRPGYTRRKRKAERWRHLGIGSGEFELGAEIDDCAKKDAQVDALVDAQVEEAEVVDEEEDIYGVNGDFEYLDERNDEEIYVYQRDSCSSPEIEGTLTQEPVVVQKPAEKIDKPMPRPRGRPRKKLTNKKQQVESAPKANEPEVRPAAESPDYSEKELRSKINDIIQANYLLEQENNNILENETHEKLQEKEDHTKEKDEVDESQKKYCCMICKARFKGSGGLRNHYKVVHATGPSFKCDECGKEFPLKERLKLHVRTHTGFKPYKCPECDKSFARGGQLVQHRRTHSQVKPYSCELCSGTFTCAANLALHVKRHNGQKDHKCDICGRGFVRRDALKKHLECLHKDVKSFLCVICNKTFKGHLPQHMRTHAQDRPHGCATCGQRFAQKSQLTVHQRTHSGQRPFRCLVCWQAFAHSTALKLHTRRHTGERPFKCAECNAGFTQLPHWKKHMKCIHGRNEPYSCRRCNSFFRIKNDLEAHEKNCQPESSSDSAGSDPGNSASGMSASALAKYRNMSIEKMRLLLAVLLKRISKPERLDELGFGKRLIDEVLVDSLLTAGKEAVKSNGLTSEFEALRRNLAVFLEWTVPKEHWENFQRLKKTPEDVLETLTAT